MKDSDQTPWKPTPELEERYHDFVRRMLDSILDEEKIEKNRKK